MADLAACYFCGTALDDALQTVRLGDGPSLTLCRSCREKLERVLDAVEDGTAADATETTRAEQGTASSTTVDDPQGPTAGEAVTTDGSASTDPPETEPSSPAAEANADSTKDATTDEERSVVAGDQDVSALEYNKVMRMLKNRDFPVDRDEFVAVAANAYQVSYTDCDRVIDAAIDQGLLEEADGRLVRPD
jgi:ribosome-binding protein aMBF1 (putative translation factor)